MYKVQIFCGARVRVFCEGWVFCGTGGANFLGEGLDLDP